jgi:hypothetical protein
MFFTNFKITQNLSCLYTDSGYYGLRSIHLSIPAYIAAL